MPFTLPNNDVATNANQSIWFEADIKDLVAGIGADGVVSGCAVTAQGSPDMTLAVAAGVIKVGSAMASVTAGNVTVTTADGTNPRIDLVVVNSSGTKSVTAGTAAANPKAPDIPASSILLAMVYVPASQASIGSTLITDKRAILNSNFTMWKAVADADYTVLAGDRTVGYTSITAARVVTLPAASALNAGEWIDIGDASGSVTGTITITINRAGSDTINGATSYVISTPRGIVRMVSDGSSKWYFDVVGPARGGVLAEGRPVYGAGTTVLTIPGIEFTGSVSTALMVADTLRYAPMFVTTPITLDRIGLEVTTAGTGAISGGTVQPDPNQTSPTGSVTGGTILPVDTIYD